MIRGIKFVGIPVQDQDVALKFYTETLGFKVATDQPFSATQRWIELLIPSAETGLALFTPEGHEDRIGQFQSISFWCDDVFATAAVLKARGATFAQEPKPRSGDRWRFSGIPMATSLFFRAKASRSDWARAQPLSSMSRFSGLDFPSCCRNRRFVVVRSFPHEMLREVYEQPEAIRRTINLYTDGLALNPELMPPVADWANVNGEVLIAASGSSRHSGLAAEILLEDLCGLAVDVEYASEYSSRGGRNFKDLRNPSVIVLSQSGETSDTLAALREARRRGQKTLAITNVEDSTMAREADLSMPLAAGRELAIPATKSFTCQLTVLALLAIYLQASQKRLDAATVAARIEDLRALPEAMERQLEDWEAQMAVLASKYRSAASLLYLGRGIHYAIAREGALKLKEASYVHAEGYPTGELKHGPNALLSDRVPLVVIATVDRADEGSVLRYEKTLQLLRDMQVQGAKVIALANADDDVVPALVSDTVAVRPASEYLLPILEVVPLQLFAYFMAIERGVDVDRPRNLAKAVVETAR